MKKWRTAWNSSVNSMEDEESLLIGVSNGFGEMLYLCGFWRNMEEAAAHNRKYQSKRYISLTLNANTFVLFDIIGVSRLKTHYIYGYDEFGGKISKSLGSRP